MREEHRTAITRGIVAGLYGAALAALTLAPQVGAWSDSSAVLASAVGVAFLGPLSFLAAAGERDVRRNDARVVDVAIDRVAEAAAHVPADDVESAITDASRRLDDSLPGGAAQRRAHDDPPGE